MGLKSKYAEGKNMISYEEFKEIVVKRLKRDISSNCYPSVTLMLSRHGEQTGVITWFTFVHRLLLAGLWVKACP